MPDPAAPRTEDPLLGAVVDLEVFAEAGAEYLLAGFTLVGGFSTNDVSVVRNVASWSAGVRSLKGES